MPPGEIFAHPGLYRLEIAQLRETLRVMAAMGIRAVDLPGTPVRLLAFAVKALPLSVSRPLLGKAVGGGRGGKMPSFHIDLHAGRGKSEVEYLNGAVAREGRRAGVSTPVNRLLTETLMALTGGEPRLGSDLAAEDLELAHDLSGGEIPLESYRRQLETLLRDLERFE